MSDISEDTVVRRHHEMAFRVIDDAALIVQPREAKLITLNPVGSRVWGLLGERTARELADSVAAEFDVSPDRALVDVIAFLEELLHRGLVVFVSNEEG
jgi:hypothetical protein